MSQRRSTEMQTKKVTDKDSAKRYRDIIKRKIYGTLSLPISYPASFFSLFMLTRLSFSRLFVDLIPCHPMAYKTSKNEGSRTTQSAGFVIFAGT